MASAAEEILSLHPSAAISRSSTLLIDDDSNNIKCALDNHVRAVQLFPEDPSRYATNEFIFPSRNPGHPFFRC